MVCSCVNGDVREKKGHFAGEEGGDVLYSFFFLFSKARFISSERRVFFAHAVISARRRAYIRKREKLCSLPSPLLQLARTRVTSRRRRREDMCVSFETSLLSTKQSIQSSGTTRKSWVPPKERKINASPPAFAQELVQLGKEYEKMEKKNTLHEPLTPPESDERQ